MSDGDSMGTQFLFRPLFRAPPLGDRAVSYLQDELRLGLTAATRSVIVDGPPFEPTEAPHRLGACLWRWLRLPLISLPGPLGNA